jgi:hypothetical protein
MWIFGKNGHLSIGELPGQRDILEVRSQLREELGSFVAMLDSISGQRHEILERVEEDYRFLVMAQRSVVAQAVAQMVVGIDYSKYLNSFHIDLGRQQPGYLLWLNATGLQVATVRQ